MKNIHFFLLLGSVIMVYLIVQSCSNNTLIRQYLDANGNITQDTSKAKAYIEFPFNKDSIPHEIVNQYSLDGILESKGKYDNGKRDGVFSFYDQGIFLHKQYFIQDTFILTGYNLDDLVPKYSVDTLKLLGSYVRERQFSKAIRIHDSYLYAYEKRGDFLLRKHSTVKARRDYEKCLELDHQNPNLIHQNIGKTWQLEGKMNEAIVAHEQVINNSGASNNIIEAESYFDLGRLYLNQKDYKKSIDYYSKAIELNPNVSEYYSNRAWTYMKWNEGKYFEQAKEDCRRALDLDSRNANAYGFLAFIEVKQGNFAKALEYANKGYKYDRNNQFVESLVMTLSAKEKMENSYFGGVISDQTNKLDWINVILTLWEVYDYYSIARALWRGSFLDALREIGDLVIDTIFWKLIEGYQYYGAYDSIEDQPHYSAITKAIKS